MNAKKTQQIDCFQCRYFFVTWDATNPRGCKAFGFKTTQMPSIVVFEASGEPCLKFLPKRQQSKGKPKPKHGWVV